MKASFLNAKGVGRKLSSLSRDYDDIRVSVAWATEGPHARALLAHSEKITRMIVGIEFYLTAPSLLRNIQPIKGARVNIAIKGVFHPKIYYFERRNKAAAIVGSANFTSGGTANNVEAALLIEGDKSESAFRGIRRSIEAALQSGDKIDAEFLASYELQYAATKGARERLAKPLFRHPVRNGKLAPLLTMDWEEYAQVVWAAQHHDPKGGLKVLRTARELFVSAPTYSHLPAIERKAIAGTLPRSTTKLAAGLPYSAWQAFGSMWGFGDLKHLVADDGELRISEALDAIPMTGEVALDHYNRFIAQFAEAFGDSSRKAGVASASRFLAMKRPDSFLCVDSKNRIRLSKALGFAHSTLDFDGYWTKIIDPVRAAPWYRASKPTGQTGRLWDCRMAMLDVIFYDPE
ncbi:phospholipase D family protein [Citromicrobium bathyomarinum]